MKTALALALTASTLVACQKAPSLTLETTAEVAARAACSLAHSDLPERFESATAQVVAQAVRVMCRAEAIRNGVAPPMSFAQIETQFFMCDATRPYAGTVDDAFTADWHEVCGVQG